MVTGLVFSRRTPLEIRPNGRMVLVGDMPETRSSRRPLDPLRSTPRGCPNHRVSHDRWREMRRKQRVWPNACHGFLRPSLRRPEPIHEDAAAARPDLRREHGLGPGSPQRRVGSVALSQPLGPEPAGVPRQTCRHRSQGIGPNNGRESKRLS
jgi:hypothetical protein